MSTARFLASFAAQVPLSAARLLLESTLLSTVARRPATGGEAPWGHRYERISAGWLTRILREQKALTPEQSVTSFTLKRFGEIGQMSEVYRMTLEYSHPVNAPRTLVLKTTTTQMKNRIFNSSLGVFAREILTYQLPHPQQGLLRPKCWYAGQNPLTHAGFLIFEDLADWRGIPACTRLSAADARRVVAALGEHHADWWENPSLPKAGFPTILESMQTTLGPMTSMAWGKARKVMAELADSETVAVVGRYIASQERVCQEVMKSPCTLVHGELNTNNMFFHDASNQVAAIDWQSTHIGNWAEDVSYIVIMCMSLEDGAACEAELIELHRNTLQARGIPMDARAHMRAYTLGLLQIVGILAIAALIIDPKKDPALYEQYCLTLKAWAEAARRHRLDQLLDGIGA